MLPEDPNSYLSSSREKLIEHLFVGEMLKLSWRQSLQLEICKPEVDNAGYDILIESHGALRHIQLKSSFHGSRTSTQKIHLSLGTKPSGCVVWVKFDPETLQLGPYLFFGDEAGKPLPSIEHLRFAKHTKGDKHGVKAERPNLRILNKGQFKQADTTGALFNYLFVST